MTTDNCFDRMNIHQKKWFCIKCSFQFESSSVFELHLYLSHKKEKTIEIKPNPEESFSNEAELLANKKKKRFCMQCSLQFESSSVFDLHLKLLHKKVIKEESIETKPNPEESFNNEDNRLAKSHKKTFVHERKKFYECNLCQYSSPRRDVMNLHILSIHEGKKPYKCDLCTYACTRKCRLNVNILLLFMREKSPFNANLVKSVFLANRGNYLSFFSYKVQRKG